MRLPHLHSFSDKGRIWEKVGYQVFFLKNMSPLLRSGPLPTLAITPAYRQRHHQIFEANKQLLSTKSNSSDDYHTQEVLRSTDGSPHFPQPLNMLYALLHCVIYFFLRSETTNAKSETKEDH